MSHNTNQKELKNRYKCKHCSKGYMMDWARQNHEKVCPWREDEK